jgi:hypothetical protein
VAIVGEFRKTLRDELDYRQEARNLRRVRTKPERVDRLLVPAPVLDFPTSRVRGPSDGSARAESRKGGIRSPATTQSDTWSPNP